MVEALQLLVLPCGDVDAARAFYSGALGLPVTHSSATLVLIRAGMLQLMLQPSDGASLPGAELVFKISGTDAAARRLRDHDEPFEVSGNDRTGRILSLRDPDGRAVHLSERPI